MDGAWILLAMDTLEHISVWQFDTIYYILNYNKLHKKLKMKYNFTKAYKKNYIDEYVARSNNLIERVVLC